MQHHNSLTLTIKLCFRNISIVMNPKDCFISIYKSREKKDMYSVLKKIASVLSAGRHTICSGIYFQ